MAPRTRATASSDEPSKMKVTVLSGFLGAGKTTLLKRILRENNNRQGDDKLKMAVIVNDMGEINLDADEIKGSKLVQEDAEMVEMHNGCICCTLRGDLLKTVKSLSQEKVFDYLVIESTGISEPLPVAQTFIMDVDPHDADADEQDGSRKKRKLTVAKEAPSSLSHYAQLDTMVSVVDALNIFDVLGSLERLSEKNASGMVGNEKTDSGEEDERSLSQLMLEQIEFANVIVVSKAHLLLKNSETSKLDRIKTLLQKLNPKAQIIIPQMSKYADLDVKHLLSTGLFDMDEAENSAGWMQELANVNHVPETEEYGISSIVFRNNSMPFHPKRLDTILTGFGSYESASLNDQSDTRVFKGVVRAKGHLWLANAHAFPMAIHVAGKHLSIDPADMPFIAALDQEDWTDEARQHVQTLKKAAKWHKTFGDRSSEIVFIGVNLNKRLITEKLEQALLTEEESSTLGGVEQWKSLDDPFFGGECAQDYFQVQFDD